MPRQLCCLGMCNISWWSDHPPFNYSNDKYSLKLYYNIVRATSTRLSGAPIYVFTSVFCLYIILIIMKILHISKQLCKFSWWSYPVLLNYSEGSFHNFFNSIKTSLVGLAVVVVGHPYMYSHWGPLCTAGSSAMQHSHSWHICLSHSYAGTMNHTQPQRQLKKSSQTSW